MSGIIEWAANGYKSDQPCKPLTRADMAASFPPRHKDCDCPLCQMDKQVLESAVEALFG